MSGKNHQFGSTWGIWDLQVQTILDDGYVELSKYAADLKSREPEKWQQFVNIVGTEEDAIKFDSRQYFGSGDVSVKNRSQSYAKNLFAFVSVFQPMVKCIAFTDHNFIHDELPDALVKYGKKSEIGVLIGTELNVSGMHILAVFPLPPCGKDTYSDGLRAFHSSINIHSREENGRLASTTNDILEVIKKIKKENGIIIFPHVFSDHGLFETGDNTLQAKVFNFQKINFLQAQSKSAIDRADKFIKDRQHFTSRFIKSIGSDSRALKNIGAPDSDGFCQFIKGEPTSEGLRQALYESSSRMSIRKDLPVAPIHRIESVKLTLPVTTQLSNDQFCLAGEQTIHFSPNYTVIIGGRGSGKSTLLNLIQESVFPGENEFFSQHSLELNSKPLKISEFVAPTGSNESTHIDFLSQNKINEFAQDDSKLTEAIFLRIERLNHGTIKNGAAELDSMVTKFETHIELLFKRKKILATIEQKAKEKESLEKIVQSFKSPEYKKLSKALNEASANVTSFEQSREVFGQAITNIESLIEDLDNNIEVKDSGDDSIDSDDEEPTQPYTAPSNEYDEAIEKIMSLLTKAQQINENLDQSKLNQKLKGLEKKLDETKDKVSKYLAEKGLEEDSQEDIANATKQISVLEMEAKDLQKRLKISSKEIEQFSEDAITQKRQEYVQAIERQLEELNLKLKDLGTEVKEILLEFRFDHENAKLGLFEAFKRHFKINSSEHNTKDNALMDQLFCVDPFELKTKSDLMAKLQEKGKRKELSQAQRTLIDLLDDINNFEIYLKMIKRFQADVSSYKLIKVSYDGKPLQESSFGQRCTAALVLLLSLGNNPIVIDEPEGHLDSLLIANYLVGLIKKVKANRQIIFATHNANLVVNGDADIVYHLEVNSNGLTKFNALTLENLDKRESLIRLEGGKEAFEIRERKYLEGWQVKN